MRKLLIELSHNVKSMNVPLRIAANCEMTLLDNKNKLCIPLQGKVLLKYLEIFFSKVLNIEVKRW